MMPGRGCQGHVATLSSAARPELARGGQRHGVAAERPGWRQAALPASANWPKPLVARPARSPRPRSDAASRAASLRPRQSWSRCGRQPGRRQRVAAGRCALISADASITNRLRSRPGLLLRHPRHGERLDRLAAGVPRAPKGSRAKMRGWPVVLADSRHGHQGSRSSSSGSGSTPTVARAVDDGAHDLLRPCHGRSPASGCRNDRAPGPNSRCRFRRVDRPRRRGPAGAASPTAARATCAR